MVDGKINPSSVKFYYESIPDVEDIKDSKLIEAFGYYLQVELQYEYFKPSIIDTCFDACDLPKVSWTRVHLNKCSKGKGQLFIKSKDGYKLARSTIRYWEELLAHATPKAQTNRVLEELSTKFPNGTEKKFFEEVLQCYRIDAPRVTVVMMWILAVDHLYRYILKHKLVEFNAALAANKDRRIKITEVSIRDHFTEIPEGKFIELCRGAKIITNDVQKILNEKLGTRNSSAHPSGIVITSTKVNDFIEDLVVNVILKFKI